MNRIKENETPESRQQAECQDMTHRPLAGDCLSGACYANECPLSLTVCYLDLETVCSTLQTYYSINYFSDHSLTYL